MDLLTNIPAYAMLSFTNAGLLYLYEQNARETMKVYIVGFILLCFLDLYLTLPI